MTLLEILVKELPGLGGWPKDSDDELTISDRLPKIYWNFYETYKAAYTNAKERVTREQYEAALAESKRVAWNGEGLPPVGCECEWEDKTGWFPVKIKYLSEWVIVFSGLTMDGEEVDIAKNLYADDVKFRPIRSEEERKRDESLAGLKKSLGHASDLFDVMRIYSAIAAGKIPHVKIV